MAMLNNQRVTIYNQQYHNSGLPENRIFPPQLRPCLVGKMMFQRLACLTLDDLGVPQFKETTKSKYDYSAKLSQDSHV